MMSSEGEAYIEVHLGSSNGPALLPHVTHDVEQNHDGRRKISHEEALSDEHGVVSHATNGPDGNVELSNEDDDDEAESEP